MEVNLSSCYSNRYLIWWKEDRSTHFMATRYVFRTQNSEPMERASGSYFHIRKTLSLRACRANNSVINVLVVCSPCSALSTHFISQGAAMGVAFSPSGDFFASVGADEQVTPL